MSKFYAQIDLEDNVCFAVSELHSEVLSPDMIELPGYQTEKMGMKYDAASETWVPGPPIRVRTITTQAWYRRLTFQERKLMRASNKDEVADLREDMERGEYVDLDGVIRGQLEVIDLFSQARVEELLADGDLDTEL